MGLGRAEHHADAVGVGRAATEPHGPGLDVDVLPRESKGFADAPALHVAEADRGGEASVALAEQLLGLSWGDRASAHLRHSRRLHSTGDIVGGETELHGLIHDLDEQRAHVASTRWGTSVDQVGDECGDLLWAQLAGDHCSEFGPNEPDLLPTSKDMIL